MRAPLFALLLVCLAPASPLAAQTQPEAEARALFEAGSAAYDEGEFARAVEYFSRSYELSGRAQLLFNMGNAYDRLGRDAEALDAFERFLAELPDADNAAFARSRVSTLRDRLASDSAPSAAPAGDPVPGIVTLSIGGAFLAATIGTAVWAGQTDALVATCNRVMCSNGAAIVEERDTAIGVTVAMGVLGVTGLAVGIALLVADSSNTSAGLQCVPAGPGLACAGRF